MEYVSIPQVVEAAQWLGREVPVAELAGEKVQFDDGLKLLAGVDGAQGWVEVPFGHWIVRKPGDASDIWPVEDKYFRSKYQPKGEDDE
jgi:hypothetical protein